MTALAAVLLLKRARRLQNAPNAVGERKGHPWFAAMYDLITHLAERKVLSRLRLHVAGGATGKVLEIGVGTAANLSYYAKAETVVAV